MSTLLEQIDAILPQTQCGECGYGGCLPYATAIATQQEAINRCPPGGVKTLLALGELLQCDVSPLVEAMQQQAKPPQTAVIREAECIGCTKCIQACPVDAIVGAAKQLHTVLASECTGCGLCVAPCPVDCIDLKVLSEPIYQADQARKKFHARQQRLLELKNESAKQTAAKIKNEALLAQKNYIQAALKRVRTKREKKED